MSVSKRVSMPGNRLLAALSTSEYQRLVPHLEFVPLSLKQILYDSGEVLRYIYFPNNQAIVSLVSTMENGSTVEVGLVGNEGMVGIPVILGGNCTNNQAIVQMAGSAMRMNARLLKSEFERGGELQRQLLLYTQALLTLVSQTAVCNRLHTVEERLSRWLLSVQERIHSDELPLTQELISHMLGTRRAGVTVAAGTLSKAGMIRSTRGRITIVNQEDLEATSCECYRLIKAEFERLLSPQPS